MLTCLQSALVKTSLLYSISRPASSDQTDTDQDLHHPSPLVLTHQLSISRPASLNQTNTSEDLHLVSALAVTPLLPSISWPASFSPTRTNTQNTLVPTPLPPDIKLLLSLSPPNQSHHLPQTPAHLHCIDRNRTVSPA